MASLTDPGMEAAPEALGVVEQQAAQGSVLPRRKPVAGSAVLGYC